MSDQEILRLAGFSIAGMGLWLTPDGFGFVTTAAALQMVRDAEAGEEAE
jgi:hypothetical protein